MDPEYTKDLEYTMDVDALDDDDLYVALREHNIAAGPIVDSTRNFYKKKLKLVLDAQANTDTDGDEVLDAQANTDTDDDEGDGGSAGTKSDSQYENSQSDQPSDSNYENSPSDTEDDQPSGISRPVTHSELRSRFHGGESLANRRTFIEKREEVEKGSYTGWFVKAFVAMIIIGTVSYFLLF